MEIPWTGGESPWGRIHSALKVAPGIVAVSTASHGGYWLSTERLGQLPPAWSQFRTFAGPGWYEEDCDWIAVALSWPELFPPDAIQAARDLLGWMDGYFKRQGALLP